MALSVRYIVRESGTNLWRNRLMTVIAILTVFVTLALAGSALLLRQAVSNADVQWQDGVSVIVWVDPAANATQSANILSELTADPFVKSCLFRSQAFDYNESKQFLPPSVAFVLTPQTTPSSYRCALGNPDEASAIISQFHNQPNVVSVSSPLQREHLFLDFSHLAMDGARRSNASDPTAIPGPAHERPAQSPRAGAPHRPARPGDSPDARLLRDDSSVCAACPPGRAFPPTRRAVHQTPRRRRGPCASSLHGRPFWAQSDWIVPSPEAEV